jgi:hypothetical protein
MKGDLLFENRRHLRRREETATNGTRSNLVRRPPEKRGSFTQITTTMTIGNPGVAAGTFVAVVTSCQITLRKAPAARFRPTKSVTAGNIVRIYLEITARISVLETKELRRGKERGPLLLPLMYKLLFWLASEVVFRIYPVIPLSGYRNMAGQSL